MKERINQYKEKLDKITLEIRADLTKYLESYDYTKDSSSVQVIQLNSEDDFDSIYSGAGFYIILTKKHFEDNICIFSFNEQTAIYRGHSRYIKKRILSHLSNERYKSQRLSSEPNYKVCLKIEEGVNGINIDQKPYKDWGWTVIVHKMRNSTILIREQAELAFDISYGKPCKSREV